MCYHEESSGQASVMCSWVDKNLSSYLCLCLYLQTHTTAASIIIPMSTTPPTPPPTAVIPTLSETVSIVVDLTQSIWVGNESTSIGQLGYTSILVPWTTICVWPPLIHCSICDSTCSQSKCPESSARYNTTCRSLVQTKYWVLIWFTVNEHWHLELTADIMELVMSVSFPLMFWTCKENVTISPKYKHE